MTTTAKNILSIENDLLELERIHSDAEKLKGLGNKYMSEKDYESAYQAYTAALDMSPVGPNSHVFLSNRAASLLALKQFREAAEDANRAIALQPVFGKAHARLGQSLYYLKDYEGAVNAYEEAVRYDPENAVSWTYLAKAKAKYEKKLARVGERSVVGGADDGKSVASERTSYSVISRWEPPNKEEQEEDNNNNSYHNRKPPPAPQASKQTPVMNNKKGVPVPVARNNAKSPRNSFSPLSQTSSDYNSVVDHEQSPSASSYGGSLSSNNEKIAAAERYYKRGNKHFNRKEFELALNEFEMALEQCSSDPSCSHKYHLSAATVLSHLKSYEEAKYHCDAALHLRPDFYDCYSTLAKCCVHLGDLHRSKQVWEDGFDVLANVGKKPTEYDEALYNKTLAMLGIKQSPKIRIPKLPPPRFVSREEAIARAPSVLPQHKQQNLDQSFANLNQSFSSNLSVSSKSSAFKVNLSLGPERIVVFGEGPLGLKLHRDSNDGYVRVLSTNMYSVYQRPNILSGNIREGDVLRQMCGVDLRRPITNVMWGDTVELVKNCIRPIEIVVAAEIDKTPSEPMIKKDKMMISPITTLSRRPQYVIPSPVCGEESVAEFMEKMQEQQEERLTAHMLEHSAVTINDGFSLLHEDNITNEAKVKENKKVDDFDESNQKASNSQVSWNFRTDVHALKCTTDILKKEPTIKGSTQPSLNLDEGEKGLSGIETGVKDPIDIGSASLATTSKETHQNSEDLSTDSNCGNIPEDFFGGKVLRDVTSTGGMSDKIEDCLGAEILLAASKDKSLEVTVMQENAVDDCNVVSKSFEDGAMGRNVEESIVRDPRALKSEDRMEDSVCDEDLIGSSGAIENDGLNVTGEVEIDIILQDDSPVKDEKSINELTSELLKATCVTGGAFENDAVVDSDAKNCTKVKENKQEEEELPEFSSLTDYPDENKNDIRVADSAVVHSKDVNGSEETECDLQCCKSEDTFIEHDNPVEEVKDERVCATKINSVDEYLSSDAKDLSLDRVEPLVKSVDETMDEHATPPPSNVNPKTSTEYTMDDSPVIEANAMVTSTLFDASNDDKSILSIIVNPTYKAEEGPLVEVSELSTNADSPAAITEGVEVHNVENKVANVSSSVKCETFEDPVLTQNECHSNTSQADPLKDSSCADRSHLDDIRVYHVYAVSTFYKTKYELKLGNDVLSLGDNDLLPYLTKLDVSKCDKGLIEIVNPSGNYTIQLDKVYYKQQFSDEDEKFRNVRIDKLVTELQETLADYIVNSHVRHLNDTETGLFPLSFDLTLAIPELQLNALNLQLLLTRHNVILGTDHARAANVIEKTKKIPIDSVDVYGITAMQYLCLLVQKEGLRSLLDSSSSNVNSTINDREKKKWIRILVQSVMFKITNSENDNRKWDSNLAECMALIFNHNLNKNKMGMMQFEKDIITDLSACFLSKSLDIYLRGICSHKVPTTDFYPLHATIEAFLDHQSEESRLELTHSCSQTLKILLNWGFEPNLRRRTSPETPLQLLFPLEEPMLMPIAETLIDYGARGTVKVLPESKIKMITDEKSKHLKHLYENYSRLNPVTVVRRFESRISVSSKLSGNKKLSSNTTAATATDKCFICSFEFGLFSGRRHTCRLTGNPVCGDCSSHIIILQGTDLRVSDGQFNFMVYQHELDSLLKQEEEEKHKKSSVMGSSSSSSTRDKLFESFRDGWKTMVHANNEGGDNNKRTTSSSSNNVVTGQANNMVQALNETRNRFLERGEKLNDLADKSEKLRDQAADFASLAKQLEKQSKGGVFW